MSAKRHPATSRKYVAGQAVIGRRGIDLQAGTFVDSHYTINHYSQTLIFKNYGYRILCPDGKIRVYQNLFTFDPTSKRFASDLAALQAYEILS